MNKIYNFINKYKKEILIILILIIISICVYYLYTKNNYEGFFITTTPIIKPKWEQLGNTIPGEALGNYSGQSVSLSSDGKTVAIGAPYNDNDNGDNSGNVRVFKLNENENEKIWEQLGEDIDGEAANDNSGYSVSLSSNGNIVAIGATNNNDNGIDSGHVRVYKYVEGSWNKLGEDIYGEAADDRSGY